MEEDRKLEHRDVPYLIYESTQARNERTVKRMITALIIAIALMFISNAIWIYAWMQYDYFSTDGYSVELDANDGGNANYIGNDGDIINGESESN